MSVSNTFTFGQSGGSVSLQDSVTVTGNIAIEVGKTIAASTTNQLETLAYTAANVTGVYIKSDVTVTIKTNSSGSPDETILITAGVPYIWVLNDPSPCLLATDCTKWYITNATLGAATFYARILN